MRDASPTFNADLALLERHVASSRDAQNALKRLCGILDWLYHERSDPHTQEDSKPERDEFRSLVCPACKKSAVRRAKDGLTPCTCGAMRVWGDEDQGRASSKLWRDLEKAGATETKNTPPSPTETASRNQQNVLAELAELHREKAAWEKQKEAIQTDFRSEIDVLKQKLRDAEAEILRTDKALQIAQIEHAKHTRREEDLNIKLTQVNLHNDRLKNRLAEQRESKASGSASRHSAESKGLEEMMPKRLLNGIKSVIGSAVKEERDRKGKAETSEAHEPEKPKAPQTPADASPPKPSLRDEVGLAFVAWCQKGGPMMSRFFMFERTLQQQWPDAKVFVRYRHRVANGEVTFVEVSSQPIEYWAIVVKEQAFMVPQPMSASQFRDTTAAFEGTALPSMLATCTPALLKRLGAGSVYGMGERGVLQNRAEV